MLRVIEEKCTGCGACVDACPFGAIRVEEMAVIDEEKCTLCGACVEACPLGALELEEVVRTGMDTSKYRGVWVFAEQRHGKVSGVAYELLNVGRRLADDLGEKLTAVVFGPIGEDAVRELLDRSNASWEEVERLIQRGLLVELEYGGHRFYMRRISSRNPQTMRKTFLSLG